MVFGHGRGDRSRSRATSAQSGRIPTHEPERRRRLSLPAALAAPPASSRRFPQSGPSQRLPSRPPPCDEASPPQLPIHPSDRWEIHVENSLGILHLALPES